MITKQTLYKKLKEKKLFSRYCLTIASTFYKDEMPRAKKMTMKMDGSQNA